MRTPRAGSVVIAIIASCLYSTETMARSPQVPRQELIAQQSDSSAADASIRRGAELFEKGTAESLQAAIPYFEEAARLYGQLGNPTEQAVSLGYVGFIYSALGEKRRALEYYERALSSFRAAGDREREATTLHNIGSVYDDLGEKRRALEYYERALPLRRAVDDRAGEAATLNSIGVVYSALGEKQTALEYYERALPLSRAAGDRAGEATTLHNIGRIYDDLGEKQTALEYYERALPSFRAAGDRKMEAVTLNSIGVVYSALGEKRRALEYYEQALPSFRAAGDRKMEAVTLNNIGSLYDDLGEKQTALEYYERALSSFRAVGDRSGEATTLNNIGRIYDDLGKRRRARSYYEEALSSFRAVGDRSGEATTLNNIGLVYDDLGEKRRARSYYEQALPSFRAAGDRSGEAATLNNIGLVYHALGEKQKAIEFYQQSLAIAQEIGFRDGERTILNNLGTLFATQNQPQLAILFLKQSVNVSESIRDDIRGLSTELQQSYLDTVAGTYRRLADLLLQENRVLEAQRVLDLLKVQELEDYLKNVRGNANTASGLEFYQPEQEILTRYNELQQNAIEIGEELARLQQKENLTPEEERRRDRLDELLTEIKGDFNDFARSPEVRELIEQLSFDAREQTLSLGELDSLRDQLEQLDAVLFYPLILDDRLELIITVPNSPPLRRTVDVSRQELNAAIVEFRQALYQPRMDATAPAQKLYRWLVEPLEEDLKTAGAEVIIYAPDGVLRYIPLAALHDGQQWLVERFRVNNITAASLQEMDTRPQPEPKVLAGAFADRALIRPAQIGDREVEFAGLPFAGIEVEGLKKTLPDTVAYVDKAFTLDAIKPQMNGYNILHFATHAAFVPGDPSESFIVFGEGENPTLRDVENWSLSNIDLVVLSACETGLGGFDNNGEQILGMGYQFQRQGARAVVASLWQVDDGGTQMLMNAFYRALQEGYSKTEALQQAQIALITGDYTAGGGERGLLVSLRDDLEPEVVSDLNHPYYWAPFILIGNGL